MTNAQILDLIENCDLKDEFFESLKDTASDFEQITSLTLILGLFYEQVVINNIDEKILALMEYDTCIMFEEAEDEVENKKKYLVLTEEEAEETYMTYLEGMADEQIYDLSNNIKAYFDKEKLIDDMRIDLDRGAVIATYDGNEYEVAINGTTYYIYRTQ